MLHVFIFVILIIWTYFSCRFRIEKEYTALKSKENEDQIELRVKFSFVWCFYGNIDQWVISQKKMLNWVSCNLFLHLVKRNFGFFFEILVIIFCNFIKNIAYGNENSRELTKIVIKNESIYFLFESYGLDMFCFFQRLRTENRLLRQRIEALEKVLPVFICNNPQS